MAHTAPQSPQGPQANHSTTRFRVLSDKAPAECAQDLFSGFRVSGFASFGILKERRSHSYDP